MYALINISLIMLAMAELPSFNKEELVYKG